MDIADPLPPRAAGAPAFETGWPVRLGDTDTEERLRLDAIARYLQDIGFDNLDAVDDGDIHPAWIVRRTVIDVMRPIEFRDRVRLYRWSSGLSNRWCNMRVQIVSDKGGLVETEAFLININPESGRPARMTDRFMAPMLENTTEHRLRWKPALQARPPGESGDSLRRFHLRVTDFDRLGHVNNAVYWGALEEEIAAHGVGHTLPYRAIVEHVGAVMADDVVEVRAWPNGSGLDAQIEVAGEPKALARVAALR